MREKLAKYLGQSVTITGEIGRTLNRDNCNLPTVIIVSPALLGGDRIDNHIWIAATNEFMISTFIKGDLIAFDATVIHYYRKSIEAHDYGLDFAKNFRRLDL